MASLVKVFFFAFVTFASAANNDCRQPGFMCQNDCTEVHLCIAGKATRALIDIPIATCTAETGLCDVTSGSCSTQVTTCYQEVDFRCFDVGAFPDPYDCDKFYICHEDGQGGLAALSLECSPGYAYHPGTASCSLRDGASVCADGPVERCTRLAQTNALPLNPSIYYICARTGNVLYPALRRCRFGHWDPALFSCVE